MKKEEKWTPHIIAAAAFVVFIVLGLACASAPSGPIYFNKSVPMEQSATLIMDGARGNEFGSGWVGWPLWLSRFDDNRFNTGQDDSTIIIPAGLHSLTGFQVTNIYTGGTTSYTLDHGATRTHVTNSAFYQKIINDITGTFVFEPGKTYSISTIPIPVTTTNIDTIFSDNEGNRYSRKYEAIELMVGGWYLWQVAVEEIDGTTHNKIRNIPNDPAGSHIRLGRGFRDIDDYDTAITYYDRAIQMYDNYADWYFYRGNAYRLKKDYDRAIEDFSHAIRLAPNLDSPYNNRGLSYRDRGEYDRAIEDLNQAIRLVPNSANYYTNRGYVYYLKKDYDNAIKDYQEALRIDRNFSRAKTNLEQAQQAKREQR